MWIMVKTYAEMQAQIASLKSQVESLKTAIETLVKLNEKFEEAMAAERARADIAVDRMLGQQGVPPITPVQAPSLEELSSMFEESPAEVAAIRQAIKERGAFDVLMEPNNG